MKWLTRAQLQRAARPLAIGVFILLTVGGVGWLGGASKLFDRQGDEFAELRPVGK